MSGKKTYIAAALSLGYAAFGYFSGNLDMEAAIQIAQVAVIGAFLRNGVAKA